MSTLGDFQKMLALCGYPANGASVGGGGGISGVKSVGLIAQSGVASSVTGTTTETALATIAIPAGAMKANGMLRITCLWQYTNSANAKPLRVRLGSISGSQYMAWSPTTSTNVQTETWIRAAGATNSQVGMYGGLAGNPFAVTTSANVTSALDMTQAQSLLITGAPGATTETVTLLGYTVEVLNP